MEWNREKASDRLRRLITQCEDPDAAHRWIPALEEYVASLSTGAAGASPEERAERLSVLLEASRFYSLSRRWREFMQLVSPWLERPTKQLLDDVFAALAEPILQAGQWGTIDMAMDHLEEVALARDHDHFWVAYAKTLSSSVNALYSLGRLSTGDGFLQRFDRIPAPYQDVTRMYRALALLERTRAHAREGNRYQAGHALDELRLLYERHPTEALRDSYAHALVELVPLHREVGDLDECEALAGTLWELWRDFPREPEVAAAYVDLVSSLLPVHLHEDRAGPFLERLHELLVFMRGNEAVAARAVARLEELHRQQPALVREYLRALVPVLHATEVGQPATSQARERAARLRGELGVPPPSEDAGPRGVRLARLLLVESVALTLPLCRGGWLYPCLVFAGLGLLAHLTESRPLERARAAVALLAALLCANPTAALLQVLVAGYWLARRWRRTFVLLAVLASLAATRTGDLVRPPPASEGELTVVSATLSSPPPEKWEDRLRVALGELRPDLLVLVAPAGEATSLRQVGPRLAAALELPHRHLPGAAADAAGPGETAVFSRFPLRLLPAARPGPDGPGTPTFEARTSSGPLRVTPLAIPAFPAPAGRRREMLDRALPEGAGAAHVVVGAVNLLPPWTAPLLAAHGFTDSAHASPWFGGTWPAWLPLLRLDGVLAGGGVEVRAHRALPSWGGSRRPVMARIRLPQPRP